MSPRIRSYDVLQILLAHQVNLQIHAESLHDAAALVAHRLAQAGTDLDEQTVLLAARNLQVDRPRMFMALPLAEYEAGRLSPVKIPKLTTPTRMAQRNRRKARFFRNYHESQNDTDT